MLVKILLSVIFWFTSIDNAFCGDIENRIINSDSAITLDSLISAKRDLVKLEERLVALISKCFDSGENLICKDSREHEALVLLGKLRSEMAIPICIRNISVMRNDRNGLSSGEPDYAYYPFAIALSQIGPIAKEQVLGLMENTPVPSTRFDLACIIFQSWFGKEYGNRLILERERAFKVFSKNDRLEAVSKMTQIQAEFWRSSDPLVDSFKK